MNIPTNNTQILAKESFPNRVVQKYKKIIFGNPISKNYWKYRFYIMFTYHSVNPPFSVRPSPGSDTPRRVDQQVVCQGHLAPETHTPRHGRSPLARQAAGPGREAGG